METKIVCPLGSECEKAKEGYIERCAWYTKLIGKNPQDQKDIEEWGCAMSWLPLMLVENAQTVRRTAKATESFRNEMVKGQSEFNQLFASAINTQKQVGHNG